MTRARKSLGQNFLVDPNLQRKIVEAVDPGSDDVIVEIGPGTGALTRHLLERAGQVIAIEKDAELARRLREEFAGRPNFQLINADILDVDLASLAPGRDRIRIAGNIPYNITSPLIFHLLERTVPAETIVLMVQREVADRIIAEPGEPEYGALTVGVRTVADVERLFHVGRKAFRPVPGVDSTVIRLRPHRPRRLDPQDEEDLRTLTRVAFSRRRKQLQKILRSAPEYALQSRAAAAILAGLDIPAEARPENLGPETFVELARALRSHAGGTDHDEGHAIDPVTRALVSLVGHELRSPVAAILGYAELIGDGVYGHADERAREGVRRIATAARQLRALIEGVELLIGQSQPGIDPAPGVRLEHIAQAAIEEATAEATLRGTSIQLETRPDIPTLRTDPDALARALALVFGAVLKAAPQGAVTITVQPDPDGAAIELDGPFTLASDPLGSPENLHSGIALRIAMAARTIHALGGTIDAGSTEGRTRMRIVLPSIDGPEANP